MKIIQLNSDNVHLLNTIAEDVFDNAIDPAQTAAFINCPRHIMVLAVDDCIVVGMASAVEYFHPDKSPQLWINEIGVTPARRNQKIGRQLIEAVIAIGQQRGCVSAWIGTEHDNMPARRCYASVANAEEAQEFLLYEWEMPGGSERSDLLKDKNGR